MTPLRFGFTVDQILNDGLVKQNDLMCVKSWLDTRPFPRLTDEQIVHFLFSCKNDVEDAKRTIERYYAIRNDHPRFFSNRQIQRNDLRKEINTITICLLPKRTENGCVVLYIEINDTNSASFDMELYMMHIFMIIDAAIYDYPPTGLVFIYNMAGMGLMHMFKLKMHLMKIYTLYLQEALPVRLQQVHLINSIWFLDKLIYLVKPFTKKDVWEMAQFHKPGMDMEWFYDNCLPKRLLPEEMGGDLPPIRVLHEQTLQKLRRLEPHFDAEELQRRLL